jgi:hypothetical protein
MAAMSKSNPKGRRLTMWRVATLLFGAVLAACGAAWAAQSLALNEAQLHIGQGPHLYVRGRNYPGSDVAGPRASDLREADAPQAVDASTRAKAEAS